MNGRIQGMANDLDMDFEPSCLVRTPSGNVYIPSGNLSKSTLKFIKGATQWEINENWKIRRQRRKKISFLSVITSYKSGMIYVGCN
jgi:hypothetical protein